MTHKYFSLVLHSHIPYVLSHGSWPHGMDWLYEAAAETYLPILDTFGRLIREGISPQVNISFTPVLMEQLKSQAFASGFTEYLKMKIGVTQEDRKYFEKTGNQTLLPLTVYWEKWYEKQMEDFTGKYKEDIIGAYKALQDRGHIEVFTSAATHSYFPLLSRDESIAWQIRQGKLTYRLHFGKEPEGFWLPECAYRPQYSWKPPLGGKKAYSRLGVDEILKQEGIGFFFVDTHLLKGGEAKGVYIERFPALKLLWEKFQKQYNPSQEIAKDPYSSYLTYPSELPFFVRDEASGILVWSGKRGYPGDSWYLEFHKKHFPGGMRYWRVTSSDADLGEKEPYDPEKTRERLEENSAHFVKTLEEILTTREEGVVVSLYDTELFGHWWFEGPEWLYYVLKKLNTKEISPMTAGSCLEHLQPHGVIALPEGSWGEGGFHWIWLNEDTSWIWEKIYKIEDESIHLKSLLPGQNERILKQFLREKFLLESSDWPFLISTRTARDYAENRVAEHFERAKTLIGWLKRGTKLTDREDILLSTWEKEDFLFEKVVTPDGRII